MFEILDLVICAFVILFVVLIYEISDKIFLYIQNKSINTISIFIGYILTNYPSIVSNYIIPMILPHLGIFSTVMKQSNPAPVPLVAPTKTSVAQLVDRNGRLYLDIPYEFRGKKYKILYAYKGKRELVSAISQTYSIEEDCSEKINTYIGPCGDFHNQTVIPIDLLNDNDIKKLILRFSDSDNDIELQGKTASLFKQRK